MTKINERFRDTYIKSTSTLLEHFNRDKAMSKAVGGDFEAVGILMFELLRSLGLEKEHTVIDVGCGSGRLACQLAPYLSGDYFGIDVVPELLHQAKSFCRRKNWRFEIAPGLSIPTNDNCADFVCFFSVFTHLQHEESYRYLLDAKRVVKESGKIVFSFLDFTVDSHWWIFDEALKSTKPDKVLSQFMSQNAIEAWAKHLKLSVVEMQTGDKPHIPLSQTVRWDDGREMVGMGNLGQSVCVLTKVGA